MGKTVSLEEIKMLLPTLAPSVPDELNDMVLTKLHVEALKQDQKGDLKNKRNRKGRLIPLIAGFIIAFILIPFSLSAVHAIQGNTMAQTLLDWLQGTPAAPWVSKVDIPATSHNITLTITDVLYDQNQIQVGYTLVPGKAAHTSGILLDNAKISLNGKDLNATLDGEETKTSYGYDGVFSIIPQNGLPESGNLKFAFSKIDGTSGRWAFNIPVTSIKMNTNITVTHPMRQFDYKNMSILIKKITVSPSTTELEYELMGKKNDLLPVLFNIKDDKEKLLARVSGGLVGKPVDVNGKEIEQFRAIYSTSDIHLKYLKLEPFLMGQTQEETLTIQINLEG